MSCITDDELAARSDWAALSPEERQRILSSGPGYEEIKKEIIAGLIEAMTTARQGFIASLRDQVSANLSPGLQPAANTLIDVIESDLEVISAVLFFDLGVVIGFGEGLAGMITGLLRIAWALLEFAVDYFVAIVFHDLEPLAEDLDALALAWHDLLSIDVMGILEGWLIRFEAAPAEGRAVMVGEFVGEVLAFIATWETSTSRLSKFLPPPGAAPQLVAAVAGGGTMAVPLAQPAVRGRRDTRPHAWRTRAPAGIQVMNMSGQGPDDSESKAGATTPSPAGPARKVTELAPGPIDPVLLPLLEGVGLVARPPSAALLQAREALRLGTCDDRRLRGAAAGGGQRRPGLHPDVKCAQ